MKKPQHPAMKALADQRREWNLLTADAIAPGTALDAIHAFLDTAAPPAMKDRSVTKLHDRVLVGIDHGFAVGCQLTVAVEPDLARRMTNPDTPIINEGDAQELAYPCTVTATVNWSGTTRSLGDATASIFLYQQLVALGAACESRFARGNYTKITQRGLHL